MTCRRRAASCSITSARPRPPVRCAFSAGSPIQISFSRSRRSPQSRRRSIAGGVGGADFFQNVGLDRGDVGDELLQLFAGKGANAELGFLRLGEKFWILHGGVEGA